MCFLIDQCILCIKTDREMIRIFGGRGRELKIAEILADHFWFRVCLHYIFLFCFNQNRTDTHNNQFFKVEEFNDQSNGICSECWEKTLTFDKFYKSVQTTHLLLLNSKYKINNDEKIDIKSEVATDDTLSMDDLANYVGILDNGNEQNANEQTKVEGKFRGTFSNQVK